MTFCKMIGAGGLLVAIGAAALVQASPIGTPAANRVPTGKGRNLGGLFDDMVGVANQGHVRPAQGTSRVPRKHLTSRQWHQAYIARHGHDLPSPLDRPGGH